MKPKIIQGSGVVKTYVVEGATLKWSFGSQESRLKIPDRHGIYIYEKSQANIMDFKPNVNILPFGLCSSLANPTVAAATAANNGKLKKMPCVPVVTMPWINGKPDTLVDRFPALLNISTNLCLWCGLITIENNGQE